jgi:hypothetical protein
MKSRVVARAAKGASCLSVFALSVGCSLLESFNGYTGGATEASTGVSDGGFIAFPTDSSTVARDTGAMRDGRPEADTSEPLPPIDCSTGPASCPGQFVFTPIPWAPPTPLQQGVCTSAEVSMYVNGLESGSAVTTSGNTTCDACLQTDATAPAYGPIILLGTCNGTTTGAINYGGCLANVDGNKQPGSCGNKLNNLIACRDEECVSCEQAESMTCMSAVLSGPCSAYAPTATCAQEYSSTTGNYPVCQAVGSSGLLAMLQLWCGT